MNYKIIEHQFSMFKDLPHLRYRVSKSRKRIYVEPFLGSGSLFLNLPKKFDIYYLAEKQPSLYNMWNQLIFKTKHCGEFLIYAQFIQKTFDLSTKFGFEDYLEYYHTNLFGKNVKEEAFAVILLSIHSNGSTVGKTIHSQRRVSEYEYKRVEHTITHLRGMRDKICLYKDFEDVLYVPESLQFINPPYYMDSRTSGWYKRDTELLIKGIRPSSDVLFVDMKNPVAESELELTDFDEYDGNMISGFGTFTNSTRLASKRNQYRMYRQPQEPNEYLYSNF